MSVPRQQGWLLWLFPPVVLAAEQMTLVSGVTEAVMIFLGVQLVSVVAHGMSSLTDWAGWRDHSGSEVQVTARKLKLVQGLMVSLGAGNVGYYGSTVAGDVGFIPSLLGAGIAAYGGDRFLTPALNRMFGK